MQPTPSAASRCCLRLHLDSGHVNTKNNPTVNDDTVTFTYTIKGRDYESNLIQTPSPAILLNGSNVIAHSKVSDTIAYQSGSWADLMNQGIVVAGEVNTQRAVVQSLALTSTPMAATDTYGLGETIEVTAAFSGSVTVDTANGTPYVKVALETEDGNTTKEAQLLYVSGSGTSALVFQYTVLATDDDDNGLSIDSDALIRNDSKMKDSTNTNPLLEHDAPGNNEGAFPAHKVDGTFAVNPNNASPEFSGTSASRSFTETVGAATVQTAANLGDALTATDDDNDTLTYSLEGTDAAKFSVVSTSGQLQTKVGEAYDREVERAEQHRPPRGYRLRPAVPPERCPHLGRRRAGPRLLEHDLDRSRRRHELPGAGAGDNPDGHSDWSNPGAARTNADTDSPVCDRTPAVRDAITTAASRTTCSDVTAAELSAITSLDLSGLGLTSLHADDLKGLWSLETLDLSNNQLSRLPEGLFARRRHCRRRRRRRRREVESHRHRRLRLHHDGRSLRSDRRPRSGGCRAVHRQRDHPQGRHAKSGRQGDEERRQGGPAAHGCSAGDSDRRLRHGGRPLLPGSCLRGGNATRPVQTGRPGADAGDARLRGGA